MSEIIIESRILPIKIREDLIVRIQDIPFDLTANEAIKLCNIITAMVNPNYEELEN